MEELYKIYDNSVAVQQKIIDSTRIKLNEAKKSHNISEINRLNSLLKLLYEEKWELEEKRRELKKYLN